ncbi:thymidine phosphorylase [Paenibacillus sp. NPDC058174]|uniref:thymidine phosphorylase n=1 Tax=Paenibacillus sp. NPDC058174 TaxID=3346366 RepID=UPI0036DB3044
MIDLIQKKKDGQTLTFDEIQFFVNGYVSGEIPDYQMSAMLMAICFNDLSADESYYLTKAMVESGETVDLSEVKGVKVDKHSTGGVGDKVSLIIAPIIACFDVSMAKMSGRGLGSTGGTIDKLESIPNFKVELSREDFISVINRIGFSIIGQSGNIVPADKKLYELRDVTATVDSIPLISSSIISKKIASGADAILLDVKFGSGAFMKDVDSARLLADSMIKIGTKFGKKFMAVLTDMNQPLGRMIGNSLEIYESMEILSGEGDTRLREFCVDIAAHLLVLANSYLNYDDAVAAINKVISQGLAYNKFIEFIKAHGGNSEVLQDKKWFFESGDKIEVLAQQEGYLASIDASIIGQAAMQAGAGRNKKGDQIDYKAGIELKRTVGDKVAAGDVLCQVYTNKKREDINIEYLESAFILSADDVGKPDLIFDVIK